MLLTRLAASGSTTDHPTGQLRSIGVWTVAVVFIVALFGVVASVVRASTGPKRWIAVDDGTCLHELRAWHLPSVAPPETSKAASLMCLGHVAELSRVAETFLRFSRRMPATVGPLSRRLFAAIGAADRDEGPTCSRPQDRRGICRPSNRDRCATVASIRPGHRCRRRARILGTRRRRAGRVILVRGAQSTWSTNAGCLAHPSYSLGSASTWTTHRRSRGTGEVRGFADPRSSHRVTVATRQPPFSRRPSPQHTTRRGRRPRAPGCLNLGAYQQPPGRGCHHAKRLVTGTTLAGIAPRRPPRRRVPD